MATARLSDQDKGTIVHNFNAILTRVTNNKVFPLADEDMYAWGIRQLRKEIREPYEFLIERAKYLVSVASYNTSFFIESSEYRYEVSHYAKWPCKSLTIRETDPLHKAVLAYVEWYYDSINTTQAANRYQHNAIHCCTSAGQITRIFPPEVIRFLPDNIVGTLGDATRKSRIPESFSPNEEELENLMQMLALGSISPEDLTGLNIHVQSRNSIVEKE